MKRDMSYIAMALLITSSVLGVVTGMKFMMCKTFMPYQAVVVGRAWADFDLTVQAIIIGMLRIIGGGFASLGIALLWLCYAIHGGARWAPWAIFNISAASLGPALYVVLKLRSIQPLAKTPIMPILTALVLIAVGVGLNVLA